jgi:transposase InsO family protein
MSNIEVVVSQLASCGDTTFTNKAVIAKIMSSLPAGYDSLLSAWGSTPDASKTLETLTLRLYQQETRMKNRAAATSPDKVAAYVSVSATKALGGKDSKGSSKGGSGDSRPNITYEQRQARRREIDDKKKETECWKCGNKGHWSRECPNGERKDDNKGKSKQDDDESGKSKPGYSYKAFVAFSSCLSAQVCMPPRKSAGDSKAAEVCNSTTSQGPCSAWMAGSSKQSSDHWYADSGCTQHMTDQRSWFTTFRLLTQEGSQPVEGIGGVAIHAVGIGDILVSVKVKDDVTTSVLTDVLFVPNLGRSLFSCYRAAQKNIFTLHMKNGCQLIQDGQVVMTGVTKDQMYQLQITAVSKEEARNAANIATSLGVESTAANTQPLSLWHRRMAHLHHAMIKKMASTGMVTGLTLEDKNTEFCIGCAYGKNHRAEFPWTDPRQRSHLLGDLVHTDLCGPMQIPSLGGALYFALFKDDATGFRVVECIKSKPDTLAAFKRFLFQLKRETGQLLKVLRSDRNTEFTNKEFKSLLESEGIRQELTTTYTPEQNGASERDNRTIVEAARSMVHESNLPIRFWGEAVMTAVYVLNRTGTRTLDNITPFEAWYKQKPSVSHLRVFGTDAYVHVPKELRKKWEPKSKKGIFMGYSACSKAYRIWDVADRKIIESRDVLFNEACISDPALNGIGRTVADFTSSFTPLGNLEECTTPVGVLPQAVGVAPVAVGVPHASRPERPDSAEASRGPLPDTPGDSAAAEVVFPFHDGAWNHNDGNDEAHAAEDVVGAILEAAGAPTAIDDPDAPVPVPASASLAPRRRQPPIRHGEWVYPINRNHYACAASTPAIADDPQTFHEALTSENSEQWKTAMQEEFDSLMANGTWEYQKLPAGCRAIQNKWIYKQKLGVDGMVDRYKARLVAKGFTQRQGIDFKETFSPTIKFDSIRTILAVAAAEDMNITQFDVKTAYLHGDIEEELYMAQPLGFEDPQHVGEVCRLRKALYGLRQSARLWNRKFTQFLHSNGLVATQADGCVYLSRTSPRLIITLFVDDGMACSVEAANIQHILSFMSDAFTITTGYPEVYVGLHIVRIRERRLLQIDQTRYIWAKLKKYGFYDSYPVAVPADPASAAQLSHSRALGNEALDTVFPYQECVGAWQWVASGTRPDISYALSKAGQYSAAPRTPHISALKRLMKYLHGTADLKITYGGDNSVNVLSAYVDADFAMDVDDRKSRSGFVLMLNGGPVAWGSKKQSTTASSTTEAEYYAAHKGSREVVWLRNLLSDLGYPQTAPTTMYSDNQAAIRLIRNPEFRHRTKHIDVRYHVIREHYKRLQLIVTHIGSDNNIADIFTKPLPRDRFQRLRSLLGLSP